jgi:hypothetical protein
LGYDISPAVIDENRYVAGRFRHLPIFQDRDKLELFGEQRSLRRTQTVVKGHGHCPEHPKREHQNNRLATVPRGEAYTATRAETKGSQLAGASGGAGD